MKCLPVAMVFLVLAGCGGSEFTSLEATARGVDGGAGVLLDAAAGDELAQPAADVDAGEVLEAAATLDAGAGAVDVASDRDAGEVLEAAAPVDAIAPGPDAGGCDVARCTASSHCAPVYEAACCLASAACGCMAIIPTSGACM